MVCGPSDLNEEAWDSWCITETSVQRRSRARPPPLPNGPRSSLHASSLPSRCGSGCSMRNEIFECSTRASSVCGQSRPSSASRSSSRCSSVGSPRGSMGMSQPRKLPKWQQLWTQEVSCAHLSVPRRHRLVQSALEVIRGGYDASVGLEEAARAAAAELILRTLQEQQDKCVYLATPRERPAAEAPLRPRRLPSLDSASARLRELAQPRKMNVPPEPAPATARSPSRQTNRIAELSKPRAGRWDINSILAEISLAEKFPLKSSSEFASAVINEACTQQPPHNDRAAMLEAYGAGLDDIWRRAKRLCKIGGSDFLRASSEPPHSART
eukprot:TRINITY_DN73510_c0_g1_i1.p1 TRINITY_DN73510_c0_g1~~TRINITY_DN73510_c0_g1_i1.p1  ORF type:complete len:326 (-),score=40.35 TRINITY_DN73510_c0_g1_i1:222-1199(-)